jgi:hypothetical protein
MILEPSADEVVKPEVAAGPEGTETLPPRLSRKERAIARATAPLLEKIKQLEAQPATAKEEPPKEAAWAKPKRADFASDEAYDGALLRWGKENERAQAIFQSYHAQVQRAKESYPDWDDVVNQSIHIGRDAQVAILELENAAEVVYYLGKNPSYAAKLGQMSPAAAIMEVGRLSARLNGTPSGEEYEYRRPRPKVPAPVRTVSTAGSSATPSFAEIAAKPNYPGKAQDLKKALAEQRR